jgi:hypothetical protein
LNKQHADNIDTVRGFIADTVALKLLVRTGLIDGSGGPGAYYNRMSQLHNRLREILINAQRQQELARKRLAMSVSKTQQGTAVASRGRWLNLRIRDELLDVQSLADGYNRLTKRLDQEIEELQEFSELLMRMMGEETPAEIEQEFRERISQGYREQHSVQVLMTTLAAMALRLSIAPPSESTMTPLIRRYDSMTSSSAQQLPAMWYLIETLREKVSQSVLQPGHNGNNHQTETNAMATNAFAAWGQMLWEHKDIELENTLSREGVMPKLLEKDNDEHIVRRLLGLRTSLFGRSIQTGQLGELYLLLPPSSQSRRFRQNLNLRGRQIVDFPDVERLLLLYVRHYVAEPLFIPEPPPAAELPAPQAEPVAELPPPQPQPAHNTTEEDTTSDDASSVAKPEDDTEDTSQDQHQDQDIHNAVTEVLSPPTGADQSTPAAAPGPDPQAQPQVQMPLPPADSDIPDPNAQGTPQLFEDEDEDEL